MNNDLTIKKFEGDCETWDKFVENGVLGTIYHTRKFINYHPKDRFIDESILIYYKEKIICVLPCCKRNDGFFSYTGATYGGPVFLKKYYKIKYIHQIMKKIFDYYDNKIEFRIANNIYFEESIFKLYSCISNKKQMLPELSWYIKTDNNFIDNIKNKRNKSYLKKIIKNKEMKCDITNNVEDYKNFYEILSNNLKKNHNTTPTHTLEEFLLIKDILKDNQLLFVVKDKNNIILGGILIIKVTNICWYSFYISKNINYEGQNCSIVYLFYTAVNEAKKNNVKYIDYGISTEDKGKELNMGLSDYKENTLGGISNSRFLFVSQK